MLGQREVLRILGAMLLVLVSGCALTPTEQPGAVVLQRLPLRVSAQTLAQWESVTFPGKLRTSYQLVQHDGRMTVRAESENSVSMLRQRLQVPADQLGRLQFSWQVDQLIDGADLRDPGASDSPAGLVLAFDGDRSTFSMRDAMLNELTRTLTGEEMPYATLMYVWSNDLPVGTVVVNARTGRIRKLVVNSGPDRLRQWVQHERDVRADFEHAFGEAPGTLQGIGIMTDSDSTRQRARSWYADIHLLSAP